MKRSGVADLPLKMRMPIHHDVRASDVDLTRLGAGGRGAGDKPRNKAQQPSLFD